MRTAESIVSEYLERGYSLECLRVLAESRSEPLCSEMLAILERIKREGDVAEVACESEPGNAGRGVVFFVADVEAAESEEVGVDFAVLAEDIPAASEESVAEILIGETDGSEVVSTDHKAEAPKRDRQYAREVAGVWSRLWSGGNKAKENEPPAETADFAVDAGGQAPETPEENPENAEAAFAEQSDGEAEDVLRALAEEMAETTADAAAMIPETAEAAEAAPGPIGENDENGAAANSFETSCDYLPVPEESRLDEGGDAPVEADAETGKRLLRQAQAVLADAEGEPAAESAPAMAQSETAALHPLVAAAMPEAETKPTSRRERRRQERLHKKKSKEGKGAKAGKAVVLPEIVLARSEGTETLSPEPGLVRAEERTVEANADENAVAAPPEAASESVDSDIPFRSEEAAHIVDAGESIPSSETDTEEGAAEPEAGIDEAPAGEASDFEPEAGDYLMIVANGGFASPSGGYREEAEECADDGSAEAVVEDEEQGNNIILFRHAFRDLEVEEEVEERVFLRVLPPPAAVGKQMVETAAEQPVAQSAETPAAQEAGESRDDVVAASEKAAEANAGGVEPAAGEGELSPLVRAGLLRAFAGSHPSEEAMASDVGAEDEHVIVSLEPDPEPAPDLEAEARAEMEREYQERLDEFARRLLELQANAAESEARIRERSEHLARRETELAEARARLEVERGEKAGLAAKLAESERAEAAVAEELRVFAGIRSEHERLYREFEDLRKAYNEVVTDVMPGLQGERDDLALTVERQCAEEERLRASLSGNRRKLAVGYSMGAAAVLALVALPLAGWLKSGEEYRDVALDRQKSSELRERLDKAEKDVVDANKKMFDLDRREKLASVELSKLEKKNGELSRLADQRTRELASLKAAAGQNGTPTRTSTMALQATPRENGALRVNEVRDPAGRINEVAAGNRARRENDAARAASGSNDARVAVSAVARTDLRPPAAGSAGASARPAAAQAPAAAGSVRPNAASPAAATVASAAGSTTAKGEAGEGGAQVVYRVMGTRDPDVIDWVIRENNIKKDRRGNPRIYPDQELRLPSGRSISTQTASAAGR